MSRNDDDPPALQRKRRSWALEEKRRIVDESLEDGASIAEVARLWRDNQDEKGATIKMRFFGRGDWMIVAERR